MASVGRQNLQVWMFWLLIASCGGLKEDDVLKSPKKEIFTRRDYSNHAKSSPQPSIKRVVYYGHLTMGTKKLNLSAEGNPIANDAELFSGSFGDSTDYQSDSSHVFKGPEGVAEGVFSQNRRTPAVDRLLGMKPKVECVENSMTLKLHGAAPLGVPFHIDRGNAYPLSLSEMPSVCGYTMRRSWRDLVFSTPYDGCFVAQKESIYVLPLVIYGIPVRMACPSVAPTPPSVTCHASGMTVKMESSASVKDVQVKVNRKWESLMKVSPQCGFSVVEHPDGVIISVKYLPCIEEQDGMFTFEVAAKGDFKISCPSLSSMHAMATACPESSSTACSPTSLDGPLNLSQTLTESITSSPPSDQSKYQNVQFPYVYNPEGVVAIHEPEVPEVPQLPPRPVLQPIPAPPDTVYPKKPAPVENPSKSIPPHTPGPVQYPAQFPFYSFKPEFYQPAPKPDGVSPKPELSEVPQLPERPVPQTTRAPLGPVYMEKPTPVEDPSKNMPDQNPEHMQSAGKFPSYFFEPGFYPPDLVPAISEPKLPEVPQHPQRPVLQSTPAPKKPAPVKGPPKSMPDKHPEHGQFPFSFFKPGFYPPDHVPAISESDYPKVPELPRRPVSQPSLAPLDPVYPTKPAPVQDPPRSMPDKHPEHGQFPFYFFKPGFYPPDHVPAIPESDYPKVPELPQRPVSQPSLAPLDPVYPTKPAPVQDPPRSMPDKHPEHGQFPFYFFKPGFYPPDHVPAIPESDYPKVPELPQRPVSQPSLAPLDPVYPTKPAPVQDPPRSMPDKNPEHGQFPFYSFKPEFCQPAPKPDCVSPSPKPELSEVPQLPERPVPQATQAPLGPVYMEKPTPVEDPSKNMPDQNPEHMQSAGKFPFSFFKPGFYPPDHVPAISESDYPKVPELPRRPVSQPSLAPLDPVYPTKPAPVQDPPRSMPDKHPEHGQFPFYFFKPGFYPPDHVPAIPESDYPKVPELPQRPVSQPSLAPLDPVYPTKPAPVQDPPRSMPDKHPEHGQFPFYFFKPGFYPPDHVPAIPESDYPKVPELPQRPVSQPSLAPLDPVYPTKPAPVQDPPRSMPDKHPEHGQFPFYFFKPGFYPPDHVPAVPESDYQVPELPGRPVPQTTRAPLGPFYPKRPVIVVEPPLAPSVPAHPPTEVPIHHVHQLYPIVTPPTKPKMPIPQSPSLVPIPTLQTTEPASVLSSTTAQKTVVDSPPSPLFDANMLKPPNRLFHQSTHCPTVCTLAHSNCCPLALSFHQHFHHHNHFAPAQNQVVQPASATSDKEPTYIQQLSSAVLVSKLDPAVKPISPQAHQLPTSKLHSNQPVKEPLPYQWAEVHTPVHSALSLNLPLATSGLGPQAVPTKVAGNGNPKSTVKPGILNVHPKNIGPSKKKSSPQSSSSGLSGEYFATHGSPLSSKHYWKPVRPHHTY
ncbi:titin-like isoform X3 [Alosa sapidissima]|uniref:titin-like isoform X3 n=1 Tax=Alosa sapidissima TaxID=34773 RepID=UPI001C0845A3|nr:titin-like isoform X3 [Alosa sapidissima]